jgi:hypothetical protein
VGFLYRRASQLRGYSFPLPTPETGRNSKKGRGIEILAKIRKKEISLILLFKPPAFSAGGFILCPSFCAHPFVRACVYEEENQYD